VPTILFFGACEVAVRIREKILYGTFARAGSTLYEEPSKEPGKSGPIKLVKKTHVAGLDLQVDTNSLGYRGAEVVRPKPAKTLRVVCIGGSTTFDILAKNDDATWPARLQKRLRANHPEVEVVNAGVSGYTIDSYLKSESTWNDVVSLSPDVIIGYFATNEIKDEAQHRFEKKLHCPKGDFDPANDAAPEDQKCPHCGALLEFGEPVPTFAQRAAKTLTDWSLFAYKVWLFYTTKLQKPVEHEGRHELPESCALEFEKSLHELARRTKALGAKPALGTFALRWRADQSPEEKRKGAAGSFNVYVGLSIDGIDKAFRAYNDAIVRAAKSEGCVLIPAAEELSGDSKLFGDSVHFSEDGAGSERMATIVARELEAAGAVTPR
jgi:lysophospholipase L1-like esterase